MMPYADTYLQPVQVAMGVADESLQPSFGCARGVPDDVLVLGHAALSFDPDLRPDFGTVVAEMGAALEGMMRQQGAAAQQQQQLSNSGVLAKLQLPQMWQRALARVQQPTAAALAGS
jgi:hypothetical protein